MTPPRGQATLGLRCIKKEKKEKGGFTGAGSSPLAIVLTGMTTVPRRTIILDRQADIKWAGSCPRQGREAS